MSDNSLNLQFSDHSALSDKKTVVRARNQAVFVLGKLVQAGMSPADAKEAVEVLWDNAYQQGRNDGEDYSL